MTTRCLRVTARRIVVALSALAVLCLAVGVAGAQERGVPTFTRDVAPILYAACVSCHRTNGPGPFPLTTWREARQHATQIAQVTRSRYMPPWKVDAELGPFVGQHPLSAADLDTLDRWVSAGSPEGNPRDLPPLPKQADGWLLGPPDLVVTLPVPYELPALSTDAFRNFAMALPVSRRRWVRGIEFHPGNARVVHHANMRIDHTPTTRALDEADPLPGYDGNMPRTAEYPRGHFLGWTPGQVAPLVSSDLAWPLDPGTDLVLQLHMQPTGAVERVQPTIGIYFSDQPPRHVPTVLRLGSQSIGIDAGDAHYVVRDSYVLPVDVELLALQPHAHYRAREVRGTATLPGGATVTLMHISDWDFRWQHVYRFERPVRLPRGTRLSMEIEFDNSDANPRNPAAPAVAVHWGQRSRDEMGDLWFQLLASTADDRERIDTSVSAKMTDEDIRGYETMLLVDPLDVGLHDDVAVLYLGVGRTADAVRHFDASATLQPESAAAQFNLGTTLMMAAQPEPALAHLRRAVALKADYVLAHNNLGRCLLMLGRAGEAIVELELAVRLAPADQSALFNLAEAYAMGGFPARAVATAQRLLALGPPEPLASQVRARVRAYR